MSSTYFSGGKVGASVCDPLVSVGLLDSVVSAEVELVAAGAEVVLLLSSVAGALVWLSVALLDVVEACELVVSDVVSVAELGVAAGPVS
ncbi:hypothetical protein HFP15_37845 [Amycolatopsis sp. K13G38]|uniref:Uncharacterized protein n=1 Tax=Amycolatopsis acididurans TaxID=2724524 RepID=A0ABX1JGW8_9PSEU|nr:hypothetical protein [Amycolatopsis acididurans]NKQ58624.1 hypothetical protein [Amycolatopsis acididurans]